MTDTDYTGPTWEQDPEVRAGYLVLDNTRLSAITKQIPTGEGSEYSLLGDYSESGDLLGIEVLW